MRFFLVCCIFLNLLIGRPLHSLEKCSWIDGGYCVDLLVKETTQVIKADTSETTKVLRAGIEEKRISETEDSLDSLPAGTTYYGYYESLWIALVKAGLAEERERVAAFEEAAAAGGTKIGGVNLVVLAARTLQKLVDLKWLTLEQAQEILNRAR